MGCRKQAHAHTIIFTRNHQCSKNFEIKSGVNSIKCVRGDVIKRTFLKDTVPGKHTHTQFTETPKYGHWYRYQHKNWDYEYRNLTSERPHNRLIVV